MENDGLKSSAKEAKKRFKTGYWQNFCTLKKERIAAAEREGKNEEEVITNLSRQAKHEISIKYNHQTEDDIMYAEVCDMLSSGEIILNPIKRLINEEIYLSLSESQKEDYVLKLSLKFQEMRERFEKEKIS